ncbi:MAG: class I SAM-dependent methyltransferase [Bacteroidota bacterium]|nr:class I SAM-dependent methyltransferase [Bacteroidota bacterium]
MNFFKKVNKNNLVNRQSIEQCKNESGAFIVKIDSYLNKDGTFDYDKYKEIQTLGNKLKIENVWVLEENIMFLANYIKSKQEFTSFGICHGTRRGKEQEWFNKYLNCNVIGTEISDNANDYPNTIQWDFHEIKEEWISNVDFIYSNSFDHSFNPERCINNWIKCLKPNGLCILEHSDYHGVKGVDDLDPFGAELIIMPYLILKWSKGMFAVTDIIKAPLKSPSVKELDFIVIKKLF